MKWYHENGGEYVYLESILFWFRRTQNYYEWLVMVIRSAGGDRGRNCKLWIDSENHNKTPQIVQDSSQVIYYRRVVY